jgi:hypothetical protein
MNWAFSTAPSLAAPFQVYDNPTLWHRRGRGEACWQIRTV